MPPCNNRSQFGHKNEKRGYSMNHNPLLSLEVATRFELVNGGFSDLHFIQIAFSGFGEKGTEINT